MKEFLLSGDNCYFQDDSERICKYENLRNEINVVNYCREVDENGI